MLRAVCLRPSQIGLFFRPRLLASKFSSDSSDSADSGNKPPTKGTAERVERVVKPKGYINMVKEQTKYKKTEVKSVEQAADLVAQWLGNDAKKTKQELVEKERMVKNVNEVR